MPVGQKEGRGSGGASVLHPPSPARRQPWRSQPYDSSPNSFSGMVPRMGPSKRMSMGITMGNRMEPSMGIAMGNRMELNMMFSMGIKMERPTTAHRAPASRDELARFLDEENAAGRIPDGPILPTTGALSKIAKYGRLT